MLYFASKSYLNIDASHCLALTILLSYFDTRMNSHGNINKLQKRFTTSPILQRDEGEQNKNQNSQSVGIYKRFRNTPFKHFLKINFRSDIMLSLNIVFYCLASLMLSSRNTVTGACNQCNSNCPTGDCIPLDITQQSNCTQVITEGPTYDCRWYQYGLARHVDQVCNTNEITLLKKSQNCFDCRNHFIRINNTLYVNFNSWCFNGRVIGESKLYLCLWEK